MPVNVSGGCAWSSYAPDSPQKSLPLSGRKST
jgi:hypothetical protein